MNWSQYLLDWDPKSNCADACPGGECEVSDKQICGTSREALGGCNGRYKNYFDKYCKKTCGICGDGASTGSGTSGGKDSGTSSTCSNACPGTGCAVNPQTICSNPSAYGGCNGQYSSIFAKYCKKACNAC